MSRDLALMAGAFLAVTLLALALGAANTATAATFGTMAFMAVVLWTMLRRR